MSKKTEPQKTETEPQKTEPQKTVDDIDPALERLVDAVERNKIGSPLVDIVMRDYRLRGKIVDTATYKKNVADALHTYNAAAAHEKGSRFGEPPNQKESADTISDALGALPGYLNLRVDAKGYNGVWRIRLRDISAWIVVPTTMHTKP